MRALIHVYNGMYLNFFPFVWLCNGSVLVSLQTSRQAGTEGKYFPPREERLNNIWIRESQLFVLSRFRKVYFEGFFFLL
jgi:hypothetical protein